MDIARIDQIIDNHNAEESSLIQILLDIQEQKHWLPRHTLLWVSRRLNVPMRKIYEIASFYEAFSLTPQGEHMVQVCMGTACHVRHSPELRATVSALLGLKPGETDPAMRFTLREVHCLGCCALAPVVKVDGTYYGNPSMKQLKAIFKSYGREAPAASRSPSGWAPTAEDCREPATSLLSSERQERPERGNR
jgi:NADH-quinone oxidoreductase subunit E